ncbi:HpcH/HpaI aldolase/citrate lyase family protein [Streptomyces sp. NPDC002476]|uniref:HpcH/HpaI aldolase/citrate lyase family protein n=1 Tax=Streptomyces sp. NPDC002476 TaxID=3364648 RepID=UPI0036A71013
MQSVTNPAFSVGPAPGARLGLQTWLVTPGVTPQRFSMSVASGADVALLDLEDSVPAGAKDGARADVLTFLECFEGRPTAGAGPLLGVRINAAQSLHGLRDLAAMAERGLWPDLLLVPKVESSSDVELVTQAAGRCGPQTQIWALIESPRAIMNLSGIVRARGLSGVLFGAADYAAATGCRITTRAMWYPRSVLAAAAASVGLPAVDSPCFSLEAPDALRREASEAAELGFVGKVAIHPRQLPVIREAFAPSQNELEAACAVLAAAETADGGITTADGAMVGPPLVAAARAVVTRARGSFTAPAGKAS